MLTPVISSAQNARLKNAIRLRRRSHRIRSGLILVEGAREILRALDAGHSPGELFVLADSAAPGTVSQVLERCRDAGAEILSCTDSIFAKLAYRNPGDGLIAVVPAPSQDLASLTLESKALLAVCDGIEKPGNIGAILRTCDAAGADAVLVCGDGTDLGNPTVIRASLGTVFSRPVFALQAADARKWLQSNCVHVIAADPQAKRDYTHADFHGRCAIVVGNEAAGLNENWRASANEHVRIPMYGHADSLNVAAAAAILLYEARRQREASVGPGSENH